MSENILFEPHRRKLLADKLIDKMMQDPKLQKKLHDISNFNSVNSYKLFLCSLFYENHKLLQGCHHRAGFLIGFDSAGIEGLTREIKAVLKNLDREYILIDANGKTFNQCIQIFTGKKYHTLNNPFADLRKILLNTEKVVIFKELSKCKLKNNKSSMVRSIIKILVDAHFNDIRPLSDLLFVDYAEFLQKSWEYICPFIKVIT
jgi:hypothetical protein